MAPKKFVLTIKSVLNRFNRILPTYWFPNTSSKTFGGRSTAYTRLPRRKFSAQNKFKITRGDEMKTYLLSFGGLMFVILAVATMAQAPVFQPVGTVRQMMLGIVAPTSDVIFKVPNQAPKDDKEWKTVQDSALMLAESGNLLLLPGRAKDNGDWTKFAKSLISKGRRLSRRRMQRTLNRSRISAMTLTTCAKHVTRNICPNRPNELQ